MSASPTGSMEPTPSVPSAAAPTHRLRLRSASSRACRHRRTPILAIVADFVQVRDRVWVARYQWFDVNVAVIGGQRGVVVVDTHASERAGRDVFESVRQLRAGPVVAVINTHEHFDHVFGNAAFRDADPDMPLHAHEVACDRTASAGEQVKAAYAADPDAVRREEVLASRLVPADRPFTVGARIDLGDREVELRHFGRGHTGGDAVVVVTDVDVVLAGDLVEESGPPAFGDDSFPLDWPSTDRALLDRLTADSLVVPGHGATVHRAFVERQAGLIADVADTICRLEAQGVALGEAVHQTEWPWEPAHLTYAIARGYEQLRR